MKIPGKRSHYLLFFIIVIAAFWAVAFNIHPVKYDMIDCYLPWRYFIGNCLQHGKLPLWNPYQSLGSPIHADPGSGVWYPLVWIIGSITGYSVYAIGFELWIHVFISAIGFYKLSRTLKMGHRVAVIAAVSYMLCGVFIGNAQHLGYIISACWLPFVLNYYLRMGFEGGWLNAVKCALFQLLMITGGYPAFTIILFYLLLIFFCWFAWERRRDPKVLISYIALNLLFAAVVLICAAGYITALIQVSASITRTSKFLLSNALFCPWTPQSAISFLFPFSSVKDPAFFDTDPSMTNAYFGAMMFLFLLLSLFTRRRGAVAVLFWFGVFAMLAAVGSALPVREFLYHYIPMMNLFRFPSVFRLFMIVGFLITAAIWLERLLPELVKGKKKIYIAVGTLMVVSTVVIIFCRAGGYLEMKDFIFHRLLQSSSDSTFRQHLAFNATLLILLLAGFLVFFRKVATVSQLLRLLIIFVTADMTLNAILCGPYTVYYDKVSARDAQRHLDRFPKGFPMQKDILISDVSHDTVNYGPFWKNLDIIQKQVSRDGFNSFSLTGFSELQDETPRLFAATTQNRLGWLSARVITSDSLRFHEADSSYTPDMVFPEAPGRLPLLAHAPADHLMISSFAPDSIGFTVTSAAPQLLIILQNDYKGWTAYINGTETPHLRVNKSLMAVVVPAGSSSVTFVYTNNVIVMMAGISAGSLLLLLIIISVASYKRP